MKLFKQKLTTGQVMSFYRHTHHQRSMTSPTLPRDVMKWPNWPGEPNSPESVYSAVRISTAQLFMLMLEPVKENSLETLDR